jgi:MoaA/NifB/PqqE/SkfB family radical SAM enzyme
MIITWDITRECNLNCIHCLNADKRLSGGSDLTTEKALDLINQFADYYVREIHFTGGEPFIRPDIFKLVRHATQKDIVVSFTTNGFQINEKISRELMGLSVNNIILSIDGSTPETNDSIRGKGAFNRVVEATNVLIREKERTGASLGINWSCVLLKPNLAEMPQLLALADKLKVTKLILIPFELLGNAKINEKFLKPETEEMIDVYQDLAKQMPDKRVKLSIPLPPKALNLLETKYEITLESQRERECYASTYTSYVTHDGLLYPCRYGPDIIDSLIKDGEIKPNQVSLDLKTNSFKDIYYSDLFMDFMKRVFQPAIFAKMIPCDRCEYLDSTRGLCLPKCPFKDGTEVEECLLAEKLLTDINHN